MTAPLVTVVVPSFNQGRYLGDALESIFAQDIPLEVFVLDGGSTDDSLAIIEKWAPRLAGWRSGPDGGQAAAINEGMARAHAPYVCWLNSDDWFLPGALRQLVDALEAHPGAPFVYGRVWNAVEGRRWRLPVVVAPFSEWLLAQFCIISQPGTLMRRSAWAQVGGLDVGLHMALDYDLWWRLYRAGGEPVHLRQLVAVNRDHGETKTNTQRKLHYQEAMAVVRKYYGRLPLKWWLAQPYQVWFKAWRSRKRVRR